MAAVVWGEEREQEEESGEREAGGDEREKGSNCNTMSAR